jgi:phage tail sheath gpL-like
MTISTTDYWLRPEDGWTLVATNPTMLVIKPDAFHPWWVAATVSGAPNAAVAASQVLTLSGNAVAAETVTIDGVVYTFRAAPSVANEVAVGGTAAISITNLVAAINTGSQGGAAHPTVRAVGTATTVTVTALIEGTGGNSIAVSETMTNASWGAGTLAGGKNAIIGLPMGKDSSDRDEAFTSGSITGGIYIRICAPVASEPNAKMHFAVLKDQ